MEYFIVRISKRDADDPQKITGTVESALKQHRTEFDGVTELLELLSKLPKGTDYRFSME